MAENKAENMNLRNEYDLTREDLIAHDNLLINRVNEEKKTLLLKEQKRQEDKNEYKREEKKEKKQVNMK